jgi:hypothetical protein|tara:strand:+ start:1104 stop:1253 length:150 start_codon:yes stop_codon:yes gene_type:complete
MAHKGVVMLKDIAQPSGHTGVTNKPLAGEEEPEEVEQQESQEEEEKVEE